MQVARLSDGEAFKMFELARWGEGPVACQCFGETETYWLKTRKQLRCKYTVCKHIFRVTSVTRFGYAALFASVSGQQ